MLKDLILRYTSRRATFKLAAVLAGMAILLIGATEKVGIGKGFCWMGAPLLLLGLVEAGYAAEQRRCVELWKKNGEGDDVAALSSEPVGASVVRFVFAVLSLSIWPFYLAVFALVAFGGEEITKASREATVQAIHNLNAGAVPQPYLQAPNGAFISPNMPQRPPVAPTTANRPPLNPALQKVTPPPFATPPKFVAPPHPPVSAQPVQPQAASAAPVAHATPAPNAPVAPVAPGVPAVPGVSGAPVKNP